MIRVTVEYDPATRRMNIQAPGVPPGVSRGVLRDAFEMLDRAMLVDEVLGRLRAEAPRVVLADGRALPPGGGGAPI